MRLAAYLALNSINTSLSPTNWLIVQPNCPQPNLLAITPTVVAANEEQKTYSSKIDSAFSFAPKP